MSQIFLHSKTASSSKPFFRKSTPPAVNTDDQLHAKAVEISRRYLRAEAELIDILQQVDQHHVYRKRGHSSFFQYVVGELHLSESVAYNLIAVSRKAAEVPELKDEIQKGNITMSNAKRIVPVLSAENQAEWLSKAATLSQRELEKEIARVRPETATPERVKYVSAPPAGANYLENTDQTLDARVKLELGLPEKELKKLRRVQDLLCQSKRRKVSLEETLIEMTNVFLKQKDPLERAKRQEAKKSVEKPKAVDQRAKQEVNNTETNASQSVPHWSRDQLPEFSPTQKHLPTKRAPIPAAILHQVNLKDQGRCTHVNANGVRCSQTRWIEVHHQIPVHLGGKNTAENLITLCSAHHSLVHLTHWEENS